MPPIVQCRWLGNREAIKNESCDKNGQEKGCINIEACDKLTGNTESFQFNVGGRPMPSRRFQTNYTTGDCIRVYESLIDVLALNSEHSVPITIEQFKSMYNFYAIGK